MGQAKQVDGGGEVPPQGTSAAGPRRRPKRTELRIEAELVEWARRQPDGLSGTVRRLMREAHEREQGLPNQPAAAAPLRRSRRSGRSRVAKDQSQTGVTA
jgi:hypothetical protein